jgi:hypothetical protein
MGVFTRYPTSQGWTGRENIRTNARKFLASGTETSERAEKQIPCGLVFEQQMIAAG